MAITKTTLWSAAVAADLQVCPGHFSTGRAKALQLLNAMRLAFGNLAA
jgi:hypothetical protein